MTDKPFSRRDFLKVAGVVVGSAAALAACAPTQSAEAVANMETPGGVELLPLEPKPESEVRIRFSQEKSVDTHGLDWVPDTRTSYIKSGNKYQFYFSAGREGFMAEGTSFQDLDQPKKYVGPTMKQGEFGINCYRAPGTVFDDKNGNLWSLDHTEEWANEDSGGNFTARIVLSQSRDNGNTWVDRGVIVDGQAPQKAGDRVSGAGQPSGIVREVDGVNFLYMYFTDWGIGPDSIHLARVPLGQIDNPDAWQKFNNGSFNSGSGGLSTPVISPPYGEVYSALSSVSWNEKTGKYISSFEGGTGFWLATSQDGITYKNYQKIADFPQAYDKVVSGSTRFSYPSLLSLDTNDQFVTSDKGVLVYSKGVFNSSGSNQMKIREFNIT